MSFSPWVGLAELRAFTASLPQDLALGQKIVLVAVYACAEGEDEPVEESHTELAALCELLPSDYFAYLLELKFAGLVTDDDGRRLRINHSGVWAARAAEASCER